MIQTDRDAFDDADAGARIAELAARLREAEETLDAIRNGEVDAVVVGRPDEPRIYTIDNADRPYRALVEQMQEGAVTLSPDGAILYCNRRLAEILRTPPERVTGGSIFTFISADDGEGLDRLLADSARGGGRSEFTLLASDGSAVPVYLSFVDLAGDDDRIICGVVTDLTQQKQRLSELSATNSRLATEIEERGRAEALLRQAQKMEAVGQLTGGLAHDFNNLLTVILGNLERAGARTDDGVFARYIDHAKQAAERGAGLTRQLLAFSRTQNLEARTLCVNDLLPGLELLIRRAIGEEIGLRVLRGDDLWHCRADPNQIESAILNLAINARDAMPKGGSLRIETANVEFGEADVAEEPELRPGRYVMVSVSDTGEGMPPEILARVFEPFFTTKEVGKGSGLGLSMVYGFVRQSDGHVGIDSKPGCGTTIRLHLPWAEAMAESVAESPVQPVRASPATVLVVEDDPHVRPLTVQLVAELGHTVLEADNGLEALQILGDRADIELLLSDVVMPGGLNGVELAREVRKRRPGMAVLLTSGYAAPSLAAGGPAAQDFRIVGKPYTAESLAGAVNEVLIENRARRPTASADAPTRESLHVLAVEDDMLLAMMLEDMLTDLGHQIVGPVSDVPHALQAVAQESFNLALLDVNVGGATAYPVADALVERGIPFAFMTGHHESSLPEAYRRHPHLSKPYAAADVDRVLKALAAEGGRHLGRPV